MGEQVLIYWYEDAILYNLDVETFQESDSDGIGDFEGLTQRLNYLAGLGVTCSWLAAFYPTVSGQIISDSLRAVR